MKILLTILLLFTITCQAQDKLILGQVQAHDDDSCQQLLYKILSGNAGGYYGITTSGILYVRESAYDAFATERTWVLLIAVWDDGNNIQSDSTLTTSSPLVKTKAIPVTLRKVNGIRIKPICRISP
jgi:hypothetical protein